MRTIVVVAPHPDDETLGCGGSLLRHRREGDSINWLIMTTADGLADYDQVRLDSRLREIDEVSQAYGFDCVHQLAFTATELDSIPMKDVVGEVSGFFSDLSPYTVYLPYRNDVHSDHQVVFDAVAACTKCFRYPSIRQVRAYETLSETEFGLRPEDPGFKPNLWIDITAELERKIDILQLYEGEIQAHPFPRSVANIRALATFRGAQAGCGAAESFMSLMEIL